jgi:UDP-N-acetylmuramoyl-tripeptide--D-alanyl-D-alanine ligase
MPACTVIGITGSNGKTTVKEMTAAVMGDASSVLYTQGNLNNAIGVPLTLLRLTQAHHYAVIEMGANHPGEIAFVNTCAQADIVLINNAANAHLAGFGDVAGVAKAKGEIISTLKSDGIVILNRDDAYFDYWQTLAGNRKILSFGLHNQADIRAEHIQTSLQAQQFMTSFDLINAPHRYHCTIALAGQHNVLNALAACAAGLAAGIPIATIITRLKQVSPVKGRLHALVGRHGQLIIDDTYNANADSLAAALNVLQHCPGLPWLVLGAFGELGPTSAEQHYELGLQIKKSGVNRLFAVGDDCQHTVAAFGEGALYCHDHGELIKQLNNALTGQETLLIKGSRSQKMEQIVASLVENFRT